MLAEIVKAFSDEYKKTPVRVKVSEDFKDSQERTRDHPQYARLARVKASDNPCVCGTGSGCVPSLRTGDCGGSGV